MTRVVDLPAVSSVVAADVFYDAASGTADKKATAAQIKTYAQTTGADAAFTQGSLIFAGASGVYSEDNTNLSWDDTLNVLSVSAIVSPSVTVTAGSIITDTSTGLKVGTATGQKVAFHNSTPVVQRAGAAQAAIITTAATQTTPFGFATQAQADAIVALANEIRAALVEKGLIKGSA